MAKLRFEELPIDKIDISISNVRKENLKEGIEDLKNSIREIGLQQPIVVVKKGDRYDLIIGQRRYLACKESGMTEIPSLITTVKNDTDAKIKSFSENIHRLDLEYRDKMQVALELLNKLGSVQEVASTLGVNPQTVRNYLGYSAVPESIKKMVDEKKLSASTATRIVKNIFDEKKAIRIAKKINEIRRSEDIKKFIDVAKENPEKNVKELKNIITKQKYTEITVNLSPKIAMALNNACDTYKSDKEDITLEALEEWLKKRGFIK